MAIYEKYEHKFNDRFRDVRPVGQRIAEGMSKPDTVGFTLIITAFIMLVMPSVGLHFVLGWVDVLGLCGYLYISWYNSQPFKLPFKMPAYAKMKDPRNPIPGKDGVAGKADGIMFLGNERNPKTNKEIWLTNSDARTHTLFLGTTGTGKTEGLKSIVSNSLIWGSGFVFVDGKSDTDLWANLYALARRFGRDDDLLVLNYMTGNSDDAAVSNSMNPFANGSASFLSNMLVSLMPDAGGDNAMWKERAVALMFALMPALTFMRDKLGILLDISVVRDYIELKPIVRLSRDSRLPERIIRALQGYLSTLPGYVDEAFDDEGNEKPPSPDAPMYDLQIARQQHGYLSMQFTRALQSLGDEYSYIFRAQLADIDMIDVVLQRRILVTLVPALEKSGEEAANLGKIVVASLKGMMGSTLGATVEGSWEDAIESKATRAPSPFITVFDEVGYYTAQGMAVMAAQARSLGFALIFAAQDLPAMEKRVKQEAQSILGNCNLKIFGKIEDPLETKKFFMEHVGDSWVYESGGFQAPTNLMSSFFVSNPYIDNRQTQGVKLSPRAGYDHLRQQREGQVHMIFHEFICVAQLYHAEPKKVNALRVHRMLAVPPITDPIKSQEKRIADLAAKLEDDAWSVAKVMSPAQISPEIKILASTFTAATAAHLDVVKAAAAAIASVATLPKEEKIEEVKRGGTGRVNIEDDLDEGNALQIRAPQQKIAAGAKTKSNNGATQQQATYAPEPYDDAPAENEMDVPPIADAGFGDAFDYRPRSVSKMRKMGVGLDDIAAIKPEDLTGKQGVFPEGLQDVPPEIAALLQRSASTLSGALFAEKSDGAE